ncbi:MAG TPA: gamma-glutamyl-gamma-aminobutyrate hydrolase family protein [Anaerolineaceae bacterium]|nr:gamma-glutamyl-gamma-aminobutyrate hydrolase family protein [Anaerolineaceae bacterium]
MSAPLIGVTSGRESENITVRHISVPEAYIQAILRAGGLPVVIPTGLSEGDFENLRNHLDGLLITGGGDIDPARFDGRTHARVSDVDRKRDDLEIGLAQLAVRSKWPFLAICRGIQVLNVALGGSLYTDLADQYPNALRHDYYPDWPRDYHAHQVSVLPESRLAHILGKTSFPTNSLHHQGLNKVAATLCPVGFAPDNLVEAVELVNEDHPFGFGVQWHPEWLPAAPEMRSLFQAFIQAAATNLSTR